jgi:ribonuclease VapC
MILDASVILAIVQNEPTIQWIERSLQRPDDRRMSWINIAEVEIRLRRGNPLAIDPLEELLHRLEVEPLESDFAVTRLVAHARLTYPLHFGDCFAYAHAKLRGEPLLTLDSDFLKTDLTHVLHPDAR